MYKTKNFSESEFGIGEHSKLDVRLRCFVLMSSLQRVRNVVNTGKFLKFRIDPKKEISMRISSGVRTSQDYDRLVSQGYYPSKTSDHFFGIHPTTRQPYPQSTGAGDVKFGNCNDVYELFKLLVEEVPMFLHQSFKQVIYEKMNSEWLHFGNSYHAVYSEVIADDLYEKYQGGHILETFNGGRNYAVPSWSK